MSNVVTYRRVFNLLTRMTEVNNLERDIDWDEVYRLIDELEKEMGDE